MSYYKKTCMQILIEAVYGVSGGPWGGVRPKVGGDWEGGEWWVGVDGMHKDV